MKNQPQIQLNEKISKILHPLLIWEVLLHQIVALTRTLRQDWEKPEDPSSSLRIYGNLTALAGTLRLNYIAAVYYQFCYMEPSVGG